MIISDNPKPTLPEFQQLMKRTDQFLNTDAKVHEDYYAKRSGKALEHDVFDAVNECAKGTPFQGSIQLISGSSFPDIIANNFYGVEVKSTEKNHWTSIGSSILESTRNKTVERIYLTFGKLGKPVEFLSRPYEECMSGIAVTHYPRYQIDMRLGEGETIFDKMGIPYDELRQMSNPVSSVSKYYKSQLKPGESLWWASDEVEENALPPMIKLWSTLKPKEKEEYIVHACVLFPELLNVTDRKKYTRYALWLASQQGIVNTNIRDGFSAGGQVLVQLPNGQEKKMPGSFKRIQKYSELIEKILAQENESVLQEYWGVQVISENRLEQWCQLIAQQACTDLPYNVILQMLHDIFCLPY